MIVVIGFIFIFAGCSTGQTDKSKTAASESKAAGSGKKQNEKIENVETILAEKKKDKDKIIGVQKICY
ncbi:hypothetical protein NWO25_16290 [Enterococcus lactis]|nr:hypothetical protein [Enterococcus lactis]